MAASVVLAVYFRRRRQIGTVYEEICVRAATREDLPHLIALSEAAGQNIVPGGGDFVLDAWEKEWWVLDPRLHFNDFAFIGSTAVAFVRCEAYGPAASPESGWLEGLRVHPEDQGRKIMSRLQRHLLKRLPATVQAEMYLAVGSNTFDPDDFAS